MLLNSYEIEPIFPGILSCAQDKKGYRFSVDAVLLAHFVSPNKNDTILDLGAGCGVISLILSHRWPSTIFSCLEIQDSLLKILKYNIMLNGLESRLEAVSGDLCCISEYVDSGSYDLVVCNPPYYKAGAGRCSRLTEKAVARHEVAADLSDVMRAAAFALKENGRAAFVYLANRCANMMESLRQVGLEPKRLQTVYPYPGAVGELVLIEAVKSGGEGLEILEPFNILREQGGTYSDAMEKCYES